ncbi:hypothetical protein AHAS_Ahas18G0273400 [Arachis hypogaea]
MIHTKSIPTLMAINLKLLNQGDDLFEDPTLYRSIVRGLQYATVTQLEVAYFKNKISQYKPCPLQSHLSIVKRVLRYLAGLLKQDKHKYFNIHYK